MSSLDTVTLSSSSDSPSIFTETPALNMHQRVMWKFDCKKGNEEYNTKKISLDVTRDMKMIFYTLALKYFSNSTGCVQCDHLSCWTWSRLCCNRTHSETSLSPWDSHFYTEKKFHDRKWLNSTTHCRLQNMHEAKCKEGKPWGWKNPRIAKVYFLADYPTGQCEDSLEQEREAMRAELKKNI